MNPTVELHQAFFWICDECGADNFCRGIAAESPFADDHPAMQAFRDQDTDTHEISGEWVMQPTEVTCAKCNATFAVACEEPDE